MSEKINKYLEEIGIRDYGERKKLSEVRERRELVNAIASHPEVGRKFDRKTYKIEEDLKRAGIYYDLKG